MVVTTTLSYTLCVFLLVCCFQSIVSLTVPSSSSRMSEKAEMDSKELNPPLLSNLRWKRNTEESTELIIKTFFLIDNTTEQEEAQERRRFQSILEGINTKLKTQGAFNTYHFRIEATEVAFQNDFYEKEDPLLQTQFLKWYDEFPQRFPNRDIHAAMLLTKRSNFAEFQRKFEDIAPEEKQKINERKEKTHLQYWQHFPTLYNESTPFEPFPAVYDPLTILGVLPKNLTKWNEIQTRIRQNPPKVERDKMGRPTDYNLGTMNSFSVCNPEHGSGVISGYGDMKYLNVFEGIFVHEFFHGLGLGHDPLFIKDCRGYIMNDGTDMFTPIGFSPCSKKAMDILGHKFKCINDQYLKAHPELLEDKQKDTTSDMTNAETTDKVEMME